VERGSDGQQGAKRRSYEGETNGAKPVFIRERGSARFLMTFTLGVWNGSRTFAKTTRMEKKKAGIGGLGK